MAVGLTMTSNPTMSQTQEIRVKPRVSERDAGMFDIPVDRGWAWVVLTGTYMYGYGWYIYIQGNGVYV